MTTDTHECGEAGRGVSWSLLTRGSMPAAIAVIGVFAHDTSRGDSAHNALDRALQGLGVGEVGPGDVRLREFAGVDTGLVVRWNATRADLFPHGGPAVLRVILDHLNSIGVHEDRQPDPLAVFPEAESETEARMLAALGRAASPRAVDLLLDQPRRWADVDPNQTVEAKQAPAALNRLIDPPLVVAIGAPNIGKSSLANALAGRAAALVADLPGTTRDHVGLTLELDGVVVRYLDTPGLAPSGESDPDPLTAQAASRAMEMAQAADLVLLCRDSGGSQPEVDPPGGVPFLRVGLRADLVQKGASDGAGPGLVLGTSAATGEGLGGLAIAVRRALVPDEAFADPRPWRFWEPA